MSHGAGLLQMRQNGFSLIEVLVAFSIMAMSLAAIYNIIGTNVRSAQAVDKQYRAVVLAEGLLARFDSAPKGGSSESGGTEDGYRWNVATQLIPSSVEPSPFALYQLRIDVEWSDRGRNKSFGLVGVVPERFGVTP